MAEYGDIDNLRKLSFPDADSWINFMLKEDLVRRIPPEVLSRVYDVRETKLLKLGEDELTGYRCVSGSTITSIDLGNGKRLPRGEYIVDTAVGSEVQYYSNGVKKTGRTIREFNVLTKIGTGSSYAFLKVG